MIPNKFIKTNIPNVFISRKENYYYILYSLIDFNTFYEIAKKVLEESKYFNSKSVKIAKEIRISNNPDERAYCIRIEFETTEQSYLLNKLLEEDNYYVQ